MMILFENEKNVMEPRFKLTEDNYRYMFDNASDAMWVNDLDGEILAANKACEELTGYTQEELIGMNMMRLFTTESLDISRGVRHKLLKGEDFKQPYEKKLIRKDGTTHILMTAASLVVIDRKVAGIQHVARNITRERQLTESLRYYVQQITRAQEEERKRIARELHDEASQPLLLLIQRLDAIMSSLNRKQFTSFTEKLEELRNQAVASLEGLRRSAQYLRPRILDDLGLVPAIEWMAEDLIRNHEVDTQVTVKGKPYELPEEVQLLLFRIAQEALSNVRRHSKASKAWTELEFWQDKIMLTIHDNGIGFKLPEEFADFASYGKLGLAGMQERARLLGGSLKVRTELGKGTKVIVEVPTLE